MNKACSLPTSVPSELHLFFWDVDAQKLNPSKNPNYVINRLLDKGNLQAARWVLKNFPKELIVETIKTRRDFSPWTALFWAHYLNIPRQELKCLNPHYLKMRKTHWPY